MIPLLFFLLLDQLVELGPVFVEDVGQSEGDLVVVLQSDVVVDIRIVGLEQTCADRDDRILVP